MAREGFFYFLILVSTTVTYPSIAAAVAMVNPSDADAITDFTKLVSNPPPSWVRGGNICGGTFIGIVCDSSGRITMINVTGSGLSGTLTPLLSSLTALEYLGLGGNKLTGTIPSLAGMASLTHLILLDNSFTALPYDFFQNLKSLIVVELDNLPLEPWLIPDAIAASTSLQKFSASNASITGQLPVALGNLKSLTMLWVPYNFLGGSLPAWLSNLTAMEVLSLSNQRSDVKFSGSINVLASFRNLKELILKNNAFSGHIPDFITSHLEIFDVRDNFLTGLVPASLQGMESLQSVRLSNNFLQGQRPVFRNGALVDLVSGNKFCLHDIGPCDPQVSNLLEVAAGFGFPVLLAQSWSGNDVCRGWIGVSCRRLVVIRLQLSGLNLTGFISPSFAKLSMLEQLDLSDNQLTGVIPQSLVALTNLKLLNVSNNQLSVIVPKFNPSVDVVLGGPPGSKTQKSKGQIIGMVVGGIVTAVTVIGASVCCCIYFLKKKRTSKPALPTTQMTTTSISLPTKQMTTRNTDLLELPIHDLIKATDDFNGGNVLGSGGYGVVFKGILNGETVAVKRFSEIYMDPKKLEEFLFEIDVLGKLRHRNLVRLLGYCIDDRERLLIYEYVPAGTLHEHLQQQNGRAPLSWAQRMNIALDVARAIEYLHNMAQEAFIHRDLKPSNILLDNDFRAKVSDFGLVRKAADKSSTKNRCGTLGYLAPEYANTGTLSTKIDVYAYGVILMEIITGMMVLDESRQDSYLVPLFRKKIHDLENFWRIVDPALQRNRNDSTLLEIAKLACHCTASEPDQRPVMNQCVNILSSMVDPWKSPINDDEAETSTKGLCEAETSIMGLREIVEVWKKADFDISDSA